MRHTLPLAVMAAALLFSCGGGKEPAVYDILIRGGTVIDGSGGTGYAADVGLRGGMITAVGDLGNDRGLREIDAAGKVVAPGFIDIHTHADAAILDDRSAHNFIRQGVTTVVGGNCGGGPVDIGKLFADVIDGGTAVNVAVLIGHNSVRSTIMGNEGRAPTPDELEQMKVLVADAMEAGAVGLSTGLKYRPGMYADADEVAALARIAADYGGFYASHLRDEGLSLVESVEEALLIGERAGIPVQISHHKVVGVDSWGASERTLRIMDEARSRGIDVTCDQYAYPATCTGIAILFPGRAIEGSADEIEARFDDPAQRTRIAEGIVHNLRHDRGGNDIGNVVIASCSGTPAYEGKSLRGILDEQGVAPTFENAAEFLIGLYREGGAGAVYHCLDDADIERIMRDPFTMHASDGSIVRKHRGAVHPRNYGNFPRVLGEYVRERGMLSLEEAVRKMTTLPVERIGLEGRGAVREGFHADLVVFDPSTVADIATWTEPHQYPAGIDAVLVNGRVVVEGDALYDERPGMALYGPGKRK